jgi:hypothetical protein
MELSPSSEAVSHSDIHKFPSILWKTEGSLRSSKQPATNPPILSQINLVHITPSYLSKIQFNIILLPMFKSFQWSLFFWFFHQNPI